VKKPIGKKYNSMRKTVFSLIVFLFPLPLLAQMESLLIGPGDTLHVQFYDTPELDQHPHVDDLGNAPLLFLGKVSLAGKTPDEAAKAIGDLTVAKELMRHPLVVVTIDQYATQAVVVLGEVSKPGNYSIATPRSILDLLSMAGGLTNFANHNIVIRHRDPVSLPTTYFFSNDPREALTENIKVSPGDTIFVPRVGFVYILGDVGRPGGYPMSTGDSRLTLLQTLAIAGSANKTATLSNARLIRKKSDGYVEISVHLDAIQKGKQPDILLEANDVIFVPFNYGKNFILNGTAIAASVASAAVYTW
jgi:polysaccharide biosynthesis/export protein